MTPAQLQILHDYILASPDLASQPMTSDGAYEIARLLNLSALGPTNIVWRSLVSLNIVATAYDPAELDALSPTERARLQTLAMYMPAGVQPAVPNVRDFFNNIFAGAGGADTRAALRGTWERIATRVERLYAVGAGTSADPATLTYEGAIDFPTVQEARHL